MLFNSFHFCPFVFRVSVLDALAASLCNVSWDFALFLSTHCTHQSVLCNNRRHLDAGRAKKGAQGYSRMRMLDSLTESFLPAQTRFFAFLSKFVWMGSVLDDCCCFNLPSVVSHAWLTHCLPDLCRTCTSGMIMVVVLQTERNQRHSLNLNWRVKVCARPRPTIAKWFLIDRGIDPMGCVQHGNSHGRCSATSLIACSIPINSRSYNQKPAYDAKWSSTITLFLSGVSLMFFARLFKANPFSASCFLKGSLRGFRSAAPHITLLCTCINNHTSSHPIPRILLCWFPMRSQFSVLGFICICHTGVFVMEFRFSDKTAGPGKHGLTRQSAWA